jgi:hypothetical protein
MIKPIKPPELSADEFAKRFKETLRAVTKPDYQFKIGQRVLLRANNQIKAAPGAYQIIERLTARNGRLRYLISSLEEEEYRLTVDEADLAKFYVPAKK